MRIHENLGNFPTISWRFSARFDYPDLEAEKEDYQLHELVQTAGLLSKPKLALMRGKWHFYAKIETVLSFVIRLEVEPPLRHVVEEVLSYQRRFSTKLHRFYEATDDFFAIPRDRQFKHFNFVDKTAM